MTTPKPQVRISVEEPRGCGYRREGGVYVIAQTWIDWEPEAGYEGGPFRGLRLVDSEAILTRRPLCEWWVGISQKTEIRKGVEAIQINTWGMTLKERLNTGECAGLTEEEAVTWAQRLQPAQAVSVLPALEIIVKANKSPLISFADDFVAAWPNQPAAALAAAWRLAHQAYLSRNHRQSITYAAALLAAASGAGGDATAILKEGNRHAQNNNRAD